MLVWVWASGFGNHSSTSLSCDIPVDQSFWPHFPWHDPFPIRFYLEWLNIPDFTINSSWYRCTINFYLWLLNIQKCSINKATNIVYSRPVHLYVDEWILEVPCPFKECRKIFNKRYALWSDNLHRTSEAIQIFNQWIKSLNSVCFYFSSRKIWNSYSRN